MPTTQYSLSSRSRIATLCVFLAILSGCATGPQPGSGPASAARAEQLLQQNNPAAAAQMYEQLAAGNPPPARNDFALAAARAWLAANNANNAQRAVDTADSGATAAQQFERELVRGEIALARGQYAPAWQQISRIPPPAQPADAARLYLLQQQVALRAGQAVEAVRAGIARDAVSTSDADRTRARRELLRDLRSAIDGGLRVDPASSRDAMIRGWLEIAQIAAAAGTAPLAAPAAIESWRSRFPGHPAATVANSEIITPGERAVQREAPAALASPTLALLLPISSTQSQAAAAAGLIREGFMAALARLPAAGRPVVRVYDTASTPVGTAMQTARNEGAAIIVGPLTRPEVQSAVEQRAGNTPVLLLNNLAGSGFVGANLYQYALAPEDEARQIARQMISTGRRSAMLLAQTGDWGTRVANAFTEELTRGGGRVVAQSSFDPDTADLTNRVTAVLGVDESRDRHQKIQRITGIDLGFEARARPEVNAIFVAGLQSLDLRQINPLLHRFAEDVPVYMTQDALRSDNQSNRDLAGMYVPDMPWMLDTSGPTAALRTSTESQWIARGIRDSRYFAFGFDAATLALAIRNGSTRAPLSGLTGRLTLNPEGRVERELDWARVATDGSVQAGTPTARAAP